MYIYQRKGWPEFEWNQAALGDLLELCQKGSLDITRWIEWFLHCLERAITASERTLEGVLVKAGFWKAHAGESFYERQRKVINRLLDGFEGILTTSKWAKLTKCSQDTALRDITDLVNRRILEKDQAGGRSTRHTLCLPEQEIEPKRCGPCPAR